MRKVKEWKIRKNVKKGTKICHGNRLGTGSESGMVTLALATVGSHQVLARKLRELRIVFLFLSARGSAKPGPGQGQEEVTVWFALCCLLL